MMALRYTDEGLRRFGEFCDSARAEHRAGRDVPPVPGELLEAPGLTETTTWTLPEGEPQFATKVEIGAFVAGFLPDVDFETARGDAGLWSWLAARYFDQITAGRTKIKERRAYVASLGFQEFYRHLLLGPCYLYFIARDEPGRVKVLLYDDPTTMNEVMVQFGSYQTLMQNPELQRLIQRLYFDEPRGRIKRGAGGKGPGSPRRLMDFLRQIELNFDLGSIRADRMTEMLPREFEKFLPT